MPSPRSSSLLLLFVLALLLGACEEAVDPILESDRNFTLYGTLDMARDTQFVRVIPIRATLRPSEGSLQGIRFTSTDLVSGEQRVWDDSLLTFADGSRGLVFYDALRIRPSHTYRIEVSHPDLDVVTRAETTVPDQPTGLIVRPEETSGGLGGEIARGFQIIVWEGVTEEPFQVDVWYRFLPAENAPFRDVPLPYAPSNTAGPDGWQARLDLRKDRITLDTLASVNLWPLLNVAARLTMLDAAFVPPGGVFDPEVLAQPGTLSNVENGFGFVGAVARYAAEWVFRPSTYGDLNYRRIEDVFGKQHHASGPIPAPLDGALYVPVRRAPGE
jgi:hypothetical protein